MCTSGDCPAVPGIKPPGSLSAQKETAAGNERTYPQPSYIDFWRSIEIIILHIQKNCSDNFNNKIAITGMNIATYD